MHRCSIISETKIEVQKVKQLWPRKTKMQEINIKTIKYANDIPVVAEMQQV